MWSYAKLTFWACFWFALWIIVAPIRHGRDNCLTYALRKWDEEGGYLVIRWCRSNKVRWIQWPHFLHLSYKHGERFLEHAVPKEKEHDEQLLPHPWFEPKVKVGDKRRDDVVEN